MLRVIASVLLASLPAFPQAAPPAFELADVHVSAKSRQNFMRGGVRAGRYEVLNATMLDLIATAYDLDRDRVLGGPSWLETDRFDVIGKMPAGTLPETTRPMLQALLAERFNLVIRSETRPIPAYVLSPGKGKHKMKESAVSTQSTGCEPRPLPPEPGSLPQILVECRGMTMEALARTLRPLAGAYVNGPVVDQTGLKGSWDFDLRWNVRGLLGEAAQGFSLFEAIDRQLGLRLESQRIPLPVLIVESVNEKPTANPPGVTTALPPPPPAEFEVADIKPASPDVNGGGPPLLPGGRVNIHGMPLKAMITLAWQINNDEMLAGLPKWTESARFDIVAKATVNGRGTGPEIDMDDLTHMLQTLIVERFKMKTHYEDRPVTAYTLVSVKPKLKPADPQNRTGCKDGVAPDAKDPREANPILSRLFTCRNMTMAQFADRLQSLAPAYLRTPVVDGTGLEGAWDFTISFSPFGAAQPGRGGGGGRGGGPAPAAAAAPQNAGEASDPNGALTIFEALNRQLGLKLEMQKRPMPVLVIDRVEMPSEN